MANKSIELRESGISVLFAYEEALGYCIGDTVTDKDGLLAAVVFTEVINTLYQENMTVLQYFQQLEQKYGVFVSYNSYVLCHDPQLTNTIFARLRTGGPTQGYWDTCAGHTILQVKDITMGYDSSTSDKKSDLPMTPDSHMLVFEFDNEVTVTFRTSGTEPKIKFYSEIAGQSGQTREMLDEYLKLFVNNVVEEMIQPTLHGLKMA